MSRGDGGAAKVGVGAMPAFPVADQGTHGCYGMNLRDYFAAKAMQGYFAAPCTPHRSAATNEVAAYCYAMADAMLAARKEES